MVQEHNYRHFVLETAKKSEPEQGAAPRIRETLDTIILGTLSTAIGIVVLYVVIRGIGGGRINEFHKEIFTRSAKSINLLEPTNHCAVAAVVGEFLGLAGIGLAWSRNRTISIVSTIGTTMCLAHIFLFFIQLLSVWIRSIF